MVAKVESARGDSNDGRTGGRAVRGSAGGCEDSAGNREEDRQARAESRRRYRGTGRAAPRRGICAPRHRAAENKGPLAGTGERSNGRPSRFCVDQILVARPRPRHLGRLPMRGPLLQHRRGLACAAEGTVVILLRRVEVGFGQPDPADGAKVVVCFSIGDRVLP